MLLLYSYDDCSYGNDMNTISLHKQLYKTRLPTGGMYMARTAWLYIHVGDGNKRSGFQASVWSRASEFSYTEKVTLGNWNTEAPRDTRPAATDARQRERNLLHGNAEYMLDHKNGNSGSAMILFTAVNQL